MFENWATFEKPSETAMKIEMKTCVGLLAAFFDLFQCMKSSAELYN